MLKDKTSGGAKSNRSQLGSCKAVDVAMQRPSVTASEQTPQEELIYFFHCDSKVSVTKAFLLIQHPLSIT